MELTAEQFAEIVGHLNGIASPESAKDKRRATRIERRTRITIAPVAGGGCGDPATPLVVMVKNLSSRGMALIADREIPPGAQYMLRLAHEDGQRAPVELLCTSVHCKEVSDGVFSVGAEFTCIVGQAVEQQNADETSRIRNSMLK
jgi:PilZ domain